LKTEVQESRSSGVQEFRSSEVQKFRSSGVQEFSSKYSPLFLVLPHSPHSPPFKGMFLTFWSRAK
jgi:hypothetical protein